MRRTRGCPRRRRRARRSARNAGAMLPTGIEPGYSVPLAGAPSPTPTPKKKRPGSAPPYAASPLSHTSSHSPSSIIIPDLSDNKGVKARARAAQRDAAGARGS